MVSLICFCSSIGFQQACYYTSNNIPKQNNGFLTLEMRGTYIGTQIHNESEFRSVRGTGNTLSQNILAGQRDCRLSVQVHQVHRDEIICVSLF